MVTSATWVVQPAPGDDQFDAVYMPYTTTQRLLNLSKLNDITVTAESSGDVSRLSREITKLLRVRHGIGDNDPDDFTVITQATKALTTGGLPPSVARAVASNVAELEKVTLEQLALTLERASRTMTWLLAAVAAVSLLVGGIGIMNITLLSVTERTREIGLRMAVGARGKDVMRQFLFEAVVISVAGGLVGIVVGVIASIGIARTLQWSTVVSPLSVVLAFGVAAAVGVFFGWYPAPGAPRGSIRLSPCDANDQVPSTQFRAPGPKPRAFSHASLSCVSAQIAVRALARNRMRTLLTMLGVIIGVAAVIAMVALGTGARGSVETSLKSAGTNIIQVSAGNFTRGGESMNIASGLGSATTLTLEDAEAIRRSPACSMWPAASGIARSRSRRIGSSSRRCEAWTRRWPTYTAGNGSAAVSGTAADRGRDGPRRSRELFGEGFDPVGERITIGDRDVRGHRILPHQRQRHGRNRVRATGRRAIDARTSRHLHTITVSVEQAGEASRVAEAVTTLLRERHRRGRQAARATGLGGNQLPGVMASADDFTVKTQAAANVTKGLYTSVAAFALANMPKLDEMTLQEMSSTLSRAGSTMTALLGSIAAISLIVGGIGIMNIMLVSVTERTKEIGLRLAVGARRRDVLLQFLVEAMVMSLIGGLLGVGVGLITAEALTAVLDWPTEMSLTTVASAFGIAAVVGIVFGYYPARRASRLDPIDSLRYE